MRDWMTGVNGRNGMIGIMGFTRKHFRSHLPEHVTRFVSAGVLK